MEGLQKVLQAGLMWDAQGGDKLVEFFVIIELHYY